MTTIDFGRPVGKPLYGLGGTDPDDPARGRVRAINDPNTFEITQNFAQHIAAARGSGSGADDIGNGFCGEPILAMAPGWAIRISDSAGAKGVRIDHGAGVWTEYWHFNDWILPAAGKYVARGEAIGHLGNSGLSVGGACHCHIELKINGVSIDPEPFIYGRPLTLGKENTVLIEKTQPLKQSIRVVTGAGNAVRTDTRVADDTLDSRTADQAQFTVIGFAAGEVFPAGSDNDRWYVFLKDGVGLRCIHSGVCEPVEPPAPAAPDTSALDAKIADLTAALAQAQANGAAATQAAAAAEQAAADAKATEGTTRAAVQSFVSALDGLRSL